MNIIPESNRAQYLSADIAWQYKVIPYGIQENTITLLIDTDTYQENILGELELITGYEIKLLHESNERINQLLSKIYRKDIKLTNTQIVSNENNIEVDDFLQKIIFEAKNLKGSDIHIEGYFEKCRIRIRIDGKLIERYRIPKEEYTAFVNKVKIKAGLDIAEKRLPQDGRILISRSGERMDIRVSVLPALYGEKIVLRLLENDSSHIALDNLGLNAKQLFDFQQVLKKPNGIILISGPTGSGKTTTLYATLKQLNKEHTNILTIEDPIEYTLDGINQVQLKENIGLTFSSALRSFLRQDPDIIMLGEIRDAETAQIAIRAALTGHLVLSTIHTNSAWGTVSRLIDMGIPAFLLANTLNMTIAQRLVRKLCIECKEQCKIEHTSYPYIAHFISHLTHHYVHKGCPSCFYTGYLGRTAIYEVIPIDVILSTMIKENSFNINSYVAEKKLNTLTTSAIELVNNGTTSIEEVYPILLDY